MSRSGYVTARRLANVQAAMSAEDWAVLHDVATVRLASATQLQRLHAVDGLSAVRRFRRQLARLAELAVLARLEHRSVGGRAAGSASYVYGLGIAGQRLLEHAGRPRRPWTPRPSWLTHALHVSELYVQLKETERNGRIKLVRFEAEPNCWRNFSAPYGGVLTLKPDAFVVLHVGEYEDRSFIEVDEATESPATLSRKFDAYRSYWSTGIEQHQSGVFPRVLWLVPSERRKRVVVDVAAREPAESWQLYAVTLQADAVAYLTRVEASKD